MRHGPYAALHYCLPHRHALLDLWKTPGAAAGVLDGTTFAGTMATPEPSKAFLGCFRSRPSYWLSCGQRIFRITTRETVSNAIVLLRYGVVRLCRCLGEQRMKGVDPLRRAGRFHSSPQTSTRTRVFGRAALLAPPLSLEKTSLPFPKLAVEPQLKTAPLILHVSKPPRKHCLGKKSIRIFYFSAESFHLPICSSKSCFRSPPPVPAYNGYMPTEHFSKSPLNL